MPLSMRHACARRRLPDRIQAPHMTAMAPSAAARANLLYSGEHAALGIPDAWRLLVKSWPFVSRYRRLLAIKGGLGFVSLTFFLMTPGPLKIVIDNVIDGHPLTGISAAGRGPILGSDAC